ncbi:13656_t:CDS:2 [Racocetra fulgida]|uniref:13656_t:CDS:1 n=1 Tax=Racocetra fulgida TaxID=60492 RepID=A0A9N9GDS5_9GLOM|nr:13656_t:CDS:2 [Racocetra fulgida]
MKSNYNGTYYTLSLKNVNRDGKGFVDFEKMQGIEGIALANVVSNTNEVIIGGSAKKFQSRITFNDVDSTHKGFRGSSSAVGLMIGVGNVGDYLSPYSDGNTFLTRDGGVTWTEVKKGAYMYGFGAQGSILVLVDDETPTNHILEFLLRGRYLGDPDSEVVFYLNFAPKLTEKYPMTDSQSFLSNMLESFMDIISQILSKISLPRSGNRYRYRPVSQDDPNDVLLNEYDDDNQEL